MKRVRTTMRWRIGMTALLFSTILAGQDASLIPSIRQDLAHASNDTARADAMARMCFNFIRSAPDSARWYGQRAHALAEKIGNPRALGDAHNNLGWLDTEQGRLDSAQVHLDKALVIFKKLDRPAFLSVTLSNLGWLAEKRGDRVGALTQFQLALRQSESALDTASMAINLYSIGTTYSKMNEYERARDFIQRSMMLEEGLGRKSKVANCLLSIGNTWRNEGDTKQALMLYAQAASLYTANEDHYGAGMVEENSGDLFLDNAPMKALPFYKRALEHYEQMQSPADKAYILQRVGLAQSGMKKYADAAKSYAEGLALAHSTGSSELVMDYELSLAELAVKQGKSDEALSHYQRHMALKDSLQGAATQSELMRLRTVFETEKAEQDNALLKTENELRRTNKRRLKARSWGIAAMAALLMLILLVLWRNYRLRGRHTHEVESFNTELAKQRDDVQHMNSLLELKVLRSQLNPHFIYNCQSSAIAMMKAGQAVEALLYLQGFARLLRMMLEHSVQDRITIEEEVNFLRQYLKLEALRVEGLRYEVNAEDVLIRDEVEIPALLVQPFVENALWHGLADKAGERSLAIDFRRQGGRLHCTVTDNGVGRGNSTVRLDDHRSLGTELTNERLQLLTHRLKQRGSFVIEDMKDAQGQASGTQVRIELDLGPTEEPSTNTSARG